MHKYITLELTQKNNSYQDSSVAKEIYKYYNNIFYDTRSKIANALEYKNRKDIVSNIEKIENDFINTLKSEKGW